MKPLPLATRCPKCGYLDRTTVCRYCKIDKTTAAPATDTHDFRDYPQRDRPDHDLDARGNPLKPGT